MFASQMNFNVFRSEIRVIYIFAACPSLSYCNIARIPDVFNIIISLGWCFDCFSTWKKSRTEQIFLLDDGSRNNDERLGAVRDLELAVTRFRIDEDLLVIGADNLLDFSLSSFLRFASEKGRSCVMYYPESDPEKQRRTAIITIDGNARICSFEEKPQDPKSDLAVPPFYYYRKEDLLCVTQALCEGCSADAPGSFAKWVSEHTDVYAYAMPGKRYSIGDPDAYLTLKEKWPIKK